MGSGSYARKKHQCMGGTMSEAELVGRQLPVKRCPAKGWGPPSDASEVRKNFISVSIGTWLLTD